jgi:NAD(P)-dependent dehydrogenase (short-subunit alcohol dehydrogenase family)
MLIQKKELTEDGFERNIGVNHFGHAYFIDLLLQKMKPQGHESRIIILASSAHTYGEIDVQDLNYNKRKYNKWSAYGSSKLANILYAKALSDKLKDSANRIIVCSVHPGVIATDLWRRMHKAVLWFVSFVIMDKTVAQGAATTLFACLSKDANDLRGQYLLDCAVGLPNIAGRDEDALCRNALYKVTHEELDNKVKKFAR